MASANHDPLYVGKFRNEVDKLDTANVNRDGSGTMVDLFVADTVNGSFVGTFKYQSAGPIGTPAADNVIRLWIKSGGVYRALAGGEIAVATGTPSAIAAGPSGTVTLNQDLAAGETLAASVHTHAGAQDDYHIVATGGDYSVS